MTTTLDLLYVALFAIGVPLWDYFVFWPAFHRRLQVDPARARMWLCRLSIATAWPLIAVGAALWVGSDRSWASFGFSVPDGWRLWMAIAVVLLLAAYQVYGVATVARNADVRAGVRKQFSGELANVLPHTRTELYWFGGVALTAGFCEEFLYRGYFVYAFSPWLGWWGAAALSLPFFAIGHLYQGWNGVLRTGIVGALFTLLVAIFGSLWPAIALHAILDLGQGTIAWLALREGSDRDDAVEGNPPPEPHTPH
ncbi:MAG: CPBP family intramembrane glutamic endopeptidase [bacterium]